jgi:hypothetical protein
MILAIDPGTTRSAWCVFDGEKVVNCAIEDNQVVRAMLIRSDLSELHVAIEMIASYGMPVGKEVFETCVWIGRFIEASVANCCAGCSMVYRKDIKLHLCNSARAKDPNVRQALIDRFEPTGGGKVPQIGTAKQPGPLYGVSTHVWAALAVAVTFHDTNLINTQIRK